jgi:hypothetical protein
LYLFSLDYARLFFPGASAEPEADRDMFFTGTIPG